jgi:hypothetical protein
MVGTIGVPSDLTLSDVIAECKQWELDAKKEMEKQVKSKLF